MSTAAVKFARKPKPEIDAHAKVWDVAIMRDDEIVTPIGLLAQPKKEPREWTLIRPDEENLVVGETKLDAIRAVKTMYADRLPTDPAPETDTDQSLSGPDRAQTIEAKIAELEAEISENEGKPEFARMAAARKGQITRLRKQLPTSAPHAA